MSVSETMASPHVSVVICTRNRPNTIGQAVASVLANDYPAFDLTVIDQSTTDATEAALKPLEGAVSRLRYVRVDEPGLSRAYNTAICRTSGEILAFTDDDCIVPQDWLAAIVAAFAEDGEADLLYGQVLPAPQTDDDSGMTPWLDIPRPERLSRKDGFKVFGMGANFAARRRLFAAIGGFDEILGGGAPLRSSQDYDLAYRAYCAGSVILLRPEVQVLHDGLRAHEEWPAVLRNYGIGDGAFYSKHVRCRDVYALWLLSRQVVDRGARYLVKFILRREPTEFPYISSIFVGIREGFRFDVDRRSRMYVRR
jgi:glycosyltransferase involved in cell wall biosynthesis